MNTKQNISLALFIPFVVLSCTKDVGCTSVEDYGGKYDVLVVASYSGTGETGCSSSYFDTITVDAKNYPNEILISPFANYKNCTLSDLDTLKFAKGWGYTFYEEELSNCNKASHYYNPTGFNFTLRNDSFIYKSSLATNHSNYNISIIGKKLN